MYLSNEVNNMKKSGTTVVFVLVCIGVLVVAFVIGICIRKIRLGSESVTTKADVQSPGQLSKENQQALQLPAIEQSGRSNDLSPEQRAELVDQRAEMRQRFENMTDEEREAFRAQMRERFGGRRSPQLQLSDEERTKMREEIAALREKWDQMSEAEREEARNQISDKYGFRPRGLGGGGRGFGDREGFDRRSFNRPDAEGTRPDAEQTEPDEGQTTPDEEQTENN